MNNECSPQEVDQIVSWLAAHENRSSSENLIRRLMAKPIKADEINEDVRGRLEKRLQDILQSKTPVFVIEQKSLVRRYRWWAAASAIIIFLGTGAYFWLQPKGKIQQIAETKILNDAFPGKSGAILTLSDGQQIELDNLGNGIIATQGNMEIRMKDGRVVYNEKEAATPVVAISYNTVTTPRGRQYQIVLPDGTNVWLNAASSLTYPTAFIGKERKIEITGEAYLEVAKNTDMPFKVKVNDATEVEVLGTHFNVNAYKDEVSINITLLEGTVKVSLNNKTRLLKPGQQAQITGELNVVQGIDLKQVVAWKEGRFEFGERTDLKNIMRQISRWYDVDVEFRENFDQSFGGSISRHVNISKVLEKLEMTGRVHFTINGRKVIVSK